jgi:hypothetical protein
MGYDIALAGITGFPFLQNYHFGGDKKQIDNF